MTIPSRTVESRSASCGPCWQGPLEVLHVCRLSTPLVCARSWQHTGTTGVARCQKHRRALLGEHPHSQRSTARWLGHGALPAAALYYCLVCSTQSTKTQSMVHAPLVCRGLCLQQLLLRPACAPSQAVHFCGVGASRPQRGRASAQDTADAADILPQRLGRPVLQCCACVTSRVPMITGGLGGPRA